MTAGSGAMPGAKAFFSKTKINLISSKYKYFEPKQNRYTKRDQTKNLLAPLSREQTYHFNNTFLDFHIFRNFQCG